MADRRDIREAAYSEMEASVSGLSYIDGDSISQEVPESDENLPAIVHNDDYRWVPMNQASDAPHEIERDSNGRVKSVTAYVTMQAQFGALVIGDDESQKEAIYEALRRRFERYNQPFWDASSIHTDVHNVEVGDSTSNDNTDRNPTARVDSLQIRLGYLRDYIIVRNDVTGQYSDYDDTFNGIVDSVDTKIDVGDDGTVDVSLTTN